MFGFLGPFLTAGNAEQASKRLARQIRALAIQIVSKRGRISLINVHREKATSGEPGGDNTVFALPTEPLA